MLIVQDGQHCQTAQAVNQVPSDVICAERSVYIGNQFLFFYLCCSS